MPISFGRDPLRDEVDRVLTGLASGQVVDHRFETVHLDLKEEAGRRDRNGALLPGTPQNEAAAQQLFAEAACMANTPGGGALIVGVSDDGALVGADTDSEWLRHRIYELSQRLLTVDVREVEVRDVRLLVITALAALEPIRAEGRIRWRVAAHCVEIDAANWHARRMRTLNYDWSAEASTTEACAVRPQALAVARDFLLTSGEGTAEDLAGTGDHELLRRLNAVTGDGYLTNAAVLVFVGRGQPCLDYMRRSYPGEDSIARVRRGDRSLLEELSEVFLTLDAHNSTRHVQAGLVVQQIKEIPTLAAREAIVNGMSHREWGVAGPTVVEHLGRQLTVTSPGGFFGGVNPDNIITHPSQSRNTSLTQMLADLRVAEREGIGVDRMVREMVRVGHRPPDIREITGPFVRASLVGDVVDEPWIAWLGEIEPREESAGINSLLLLRRLLTHGWFDTDSAAAITQTTVEVARGAIRKLAAASVSGKPLLGSVEGVPTGAETAWSLHPAAAAVLARQDRNLDHRRVAPTRSEIARSYAEARGRISSTELASIVDASPSNVGEVLKSLRDEGALEPSNPTGRGRGFFYRWVG